MITRFAPSPTGPLHLGHAYSALLIHDRARAEDGQFLLRIEDTDSTRCRANWEQEIYDDLSWLGIAWDAPPRRQSDHYADYWAALDRLAPCLYPCSCTRRQIAEAGGQPGADGLVYPGTCRDRPLSDAKPGDAIRLDIARALATVSLPPFTEEGHAPQRPSPDFLRDQIGDPVLRRKDSGDPAYHLAVVVDDALQGITHVIRGADLINATPLHVLLQSLLGLPTPIYHHHRLIKDDSGKRLAKINASKAIATYRAEGANPADIRRMVGL